MIEKLCYCILAVEHFTFPHFLPISTFLEHDADIKLRMNVYLQKPIKFFSLTVNIVLWFCIQLNLGGKGLVKHCIVVVHFINALWTMA